MRHHYGVRFLLRILRQQTREWLLSVIPKYYHTWNATVQERSDFRCSCELRWLGGYWQLWYRMVSNKHRPNTLSCCQSQFSTHKGVLQWAAARWGHRTLALALQSWWVFAEERAQQSQGVHAALLQWTQYQLVRAWRMWCSCSDTQNIGLRGLKRWSSGMLWFGFKAWLDYCEHADRQYALLEQAILRWRMVTVAYAYSLLESIASRMRRQRASIKHSLSHWIYQNVAHAWNR